MFFCGNICHGALVNAWFNEVHYDNVGDDSGEFLEVAVSSDFTDLGNLVVTLYNGETANAGVPYGTATALSSFTVGQTSQGIRLYYITFPLNGLQNGSRDGFALTHLGTVIQVLSYEGTFTASSGVANGQTSTDIGVSETSSTAVSASLGLQGAGSSYGEFSWTTFSDDTPGAFNTGQTINPVPEPTTWAGIIFGALFCGVQVVRRLRTVRR